MKRFVNFIRDIIYSLNYLLFTLIIIALVAFILYNRIDYMFTENYAVESEGKTKSLSTVEREAVFSDDENRIEISVTLPEGAELSSKAEIIQQSGLIDDSGKLLNIINTYNLSDKVGSGEFKIQKGSSLEDIINIITSNALAEAKDS